MSSCHSIRAVLHANVIDQSQVSQRSRQARYSPALEPPSWTSLRSDDNIAGIYLATFCNGDSYVFYRRDLQALRCVSSIWCRTRDQESGPGRRRSAMSMRLVRAHPDSRPRGAVPDA
jgi:hypothetical protein